MRIKKIVFFLLPVSIVAEAFLLNVNLNHQPGIEAAASNEQQISAVEPHVQQLVEQEIIPPPSAPVSVQALPDVPLKAAFAMEMYEDHKVLFEQNATKQLPIASLTKLMTSAVVMDHYDLNQKVIISPKAMAVAGEQGALKLGEQLSVKNLLYITLMESSNRAAQALSEVMGHDAFVKAMNDKAAQIGLLQTHFDGVTGLSSSTYSTALDIAKLSEFLFDNYPLFREIIGLKEYQLYTDDGHFHHTLVSTNKLLGEEGIVGGKTGWTNEAQGCMMAIQAVGDKHIVYVVLGAGDRFLETKKIIDQDSSTGQ